MKSSLKHNIVFSLCLWGWLAVVAGASAQEARNAIESLRADLKADRTAAIAEAMMFTAEESEAFWPIYRKYRAEVEKTSDTIVKLVLEYADLYPNVPEKKAAEMLKEYARTEAELLGVKRKHFKKMGKVLPASKLFRFVQLDNRLDLGTRLALAASVPVLPVQQTTPDAQTVPK